MILMLRLAELLDHMEVILGAGLEGKNGMEVQKEIRVHIAHVMDYWQVGKRQKKQRLCRKQDCEIILRNRQVESKVSSMSLKDTKLIRGKHN